MRYHVAQGLVSAADHTLASYTRYEDALDRALAEYDVSPLDTKIEIRHAGLIVWGPFVVGSKRYTPIARAGQ